MFHHYTVLIRSLSNGTSGKQRTEMKTDTLNICVFVVLGCYCFKSEWPLIYFTQEKKILSFAILYFQRLLASFLLLLVPVLSCGHAVCATTNTTG